MGTLVNSHICSCYNIHVDALNSWWPNCTGVGNTTELSPQQSAFYVTILHSHNLIYANICSLG